MKRFYSINVERRLRLFFAVVIVPAGAVCAFMQLRDGMIFVLFAPFVPIFFYPECLAWAASQLFLCKKKRKPVMQSVIMALHCSQPAKVC